MTEKPASLKVVSGVWFVIGCFELSRCALGFANLIAMQISNADSPPRPEAAGLVPVMVAGGYALTLVWTAIAALITVSAIHLWKLRSWARTSLEVVSWMGLSFVVGLGLFWLYMFLEMTSRAPIAVRDRMDWMAWVVLGFVTIVSIAHGASIRVLRSRAVRDAIASAASDGAGIDAAAQRSPYEVPGLPSA